MTDDELRAALDTAAIRTAIRDVVAVHVGSSRADAVTNDVVAALATSAPDEGPRPCTHAWETDDDICPECGADWGPYLRRETDARPAVPALDAIDITRLTAVLWGMDLHGNAALWGFDASALAERIAREYAALAASAPDEGPHITSTDQLEAEQRGLPIPFARPAAAPALDRETWIAGWMAGVRQMTTWPEQSIRVEAERQYARLSSKEPTDDTLREALERMRRAYERGADRDDLVRLVDAALAATDEGLTCNCGIPGPHRLTCPVSIEAGKRIAALNDKADDMNIGYVARPAVPALDPTEWIARGGEVVECGRCGTQYANASIAMGHRCPPAVPALDDEVREALWSLLSTACHCEPAFTERDKHATDCHYDFIRWFLDEDQIVALREYAEEPAEGPDEAWETWDKTPYARPTPAREGLDEVSRRLNWLADRLVNVYGESENLDYIQSTRRLAASHWTDPKG